VTPPAEFDDIADCYDATRGGEARGDQYAEDVDEVLPDDGGTVLEFGVGTGVVSLGLRRRGRRVVGIDVSRPMLARASARLGNVLAQGDAAAMPVASSSVAHAVGVWVLHAVADPVRLFREVARIVRPGGLTVVCTAQQPAPDDAVGRVIQEMSERVDAARGGRSRRVTAVEALEWARAAGLVGETTERTRSWRARASDELRAIEERSWPAMRALDAATCATVTRPAVEALRSFPDTDVERRAVCELVVLRHAPTGP
jgi:ubiquinone/menaquinone biosynthesis C-methylase UbiE